MPSCEMLPQAFCPRCEHSPDSLTAELYRTQRHRASTSMVRLVLPFRMVEQVVEKRGRCCLAAVIASRFQGWFSVPSSLRSAYSYHYPSRPSCEIANMGTVVCKFQIKRVGEPALSIVGAFTVQAKSCVAAAVRV